MTICKYCEQNFDEPDNSHLCFNIKNAWKCGVKNGGLDKR